MNIHKMLSDNSKDSPDPSESLENFQSFPEVQSLSQHSGQGPASTPSSIPSRPHPSSNPHAGSRMNQHNSQNNTNGQSRFKNIMNRNSQGYKDFPHQPSNNYYQHPNHNHNHYQQQPPSNYDQQHRPSQYGPKPQPPIRFTKGDPRIPRKYKTPPRWAQDWPSYQAELEQLKINDPEGYKRHKQVNTAPYPKDHIRSRPNQHLRQQQQQHSAPREMAAPPVSLHNPSKPPRHVHNVPYSLSGVVQYDDIVRQLTGWVYGCLDSLDRENRLDSVEAELKFGSVRFPRDVPLYFVSEALINKSAFERNGPMFVASIPEDLYKRLMDKLGDICENKDNGNNSSQGLKPSISKSESDTMDVFYYLKDEKLRITYEIPDKLPLQEAVKLVKDNNAEEVCRIMKAARDHKEVATKHALDFRVTVSTENEQPTSGFDVKNYHQEQQNARPPYMRRKQRVSYHIDDIMTIDTTVVQPVRNNGRPEQPSCEIEFELNQKALIKAYQRAKEGDGEVLEELVSFWINSAREMIRKVG